MNATYIFENGIKTFCTVPRKSTLLIAKFINFFIKLYVRK